MFKISEFAQFSRVSVKMLRHYDEIGLLSPAHVDPFTNYRYYSAGQLPRLHRIIALKDLGFSLAQISLILDESLTSEELRGLLKVQRAETRQQLQETQTRLAQLDARLASLAEEEKLPDYEVIMRATRPEFVATMHACHDEGENEVTALFEALETYVARFNARAPLPPFLLYPPAGEEGPAMQVAVPITREIPAGDCITNQYLPGYERVACVLHTGRYDTLSLAYSALLTWVETHHYQPAGPLREVYLRFGADQTSYTLPDAYLAHHAAELITELQIPVIVDRGPETEDRGM